MENEVPRYENPLFLQKNSLPSLHWYSGGKIINGILHYPYGVEIDKNQAAKAQAFLDYSYCTGNAPTPKPDMVCLYGDAYLKRFEVLERKPTAFGASERLHHKGIYEESNLQML